MAFPREPLQQGEVWNIRLMTAWIMNNPFGKSGPFNQGFVVIHLLLSVGRQMGVPWSELAGFPHKLLILPEPLAVLYYHVVAAISS